MKAVLMTHEPEPERFDPHPGWPHTRVQAIVVLLGIAMVATYFTACWAGVGA